MTRQRLTDEEAAAFNAYLGTVPASIYMSMAQVTDDPEIQAKMPRVAEFLERLNEGLTEVFGEINWGMDPENPAQDGAAADRRAMLALATALGMEGEGESGEEMEIIE